MRRTATRLIAELHPGNFLRPVVALFVVTTHSFCHHFAEVNLSERHVTVLVQSGALQNLSRKVLGKPFSEDDSSVMFVILCLTRSYQIDDIIRELRQIEFSVRGKRLGLCIFHRNHKICLSCNGSSICQPARLATHGFNNVVRRCCQSVSTKVQHFLGHDVNSREEAKCKVNTLVIVVNRFRKMNDADMRRAGWKRLLVVYHQVGSAQCIIASDRNKRVNLQIYQRGVNIPEFLRFRLIHDILLRLNRLPRIRASGPNDNAAAVAQAA
mmetsp:Transcript_3282/g.9079  ORF Transcript_3282/g.9079 Transcript_3282/m.9079 type:complete len:268 (+) Transcript_3282:391-1194(+)